MRMIALASLLLTLTACGNESSAGGSLTGKSYLSIGVTEHGKEKQLAPNTRVRLQFTDDGRLVADAGCNSMQAEVSTSGGKLTLKGELASTAMGCPTPQGDQDAWLAKILAAKPKWKADGDQLDVSTGGTTISLVDHDTTEPSPALMGTKWSLVAVLSGDTASHQEGSEQAWLTINGERVTGSTGCNTFQGMVAHTNKTLTFGELATTRRACTGDALKLETTLLTTLKGDVTYTIDSSTLRLRTATNGLDFKP
jgi:heat shock protein HslJ